MSNDLEVKVKGVGDVAAALRGLPPKIRGRVLLNALRAGARIVRDAARARTPVLSSPVVRGGRVIRKPGTVRNAISVRTSKQAKRSGDLGVFVNVRPAKGAIFRNGKQVRAKQKGANSPDDPYYWQWLNFGRAARTGVSARSRVQRIKRRGVELVKGVRARRALRAVGAMRAFGFLEAGAQRLTEALRRIETVLGPQIQKFNDKGGSK